MNSLQYLSNQVDKVIGQDRYTILEEEEPQDLKQHNDIQPKDQRPHSEDLPKITDGDQEKTIENIADTKAASGSLAATFFLYNWLLIILSNIRWAFGKSRRTSSNRTTSVGTNNGPSLLGNNVAATATGAVTADDRQLQSPYARSHKPRLSTSSTPYMKVAPPPRPLLKRHVLSSTSSHANTKTLVLDLDETLIHSLSRGAKFSQGQMVEVKLNNQFTSLYLVNKRPHCDYFLKCVSQWYKLVVFTASVPAYADPMIDWLERDRKYFDRRFYRNDCTNSDDGYIKDLTKVEQELSQIIIIDNSPISYSLQQGNGISIDGWINDPSDHSLLNLLPVLEALRYCTDVRSILGLKAGIIGELGK